MQTAEEIRKITKSHNTGLKEIEDQVVKTTRAKLAKPHMDCIGQLINAAAESGRHQIKYGPNTLIGQEQAFIWKWSYTANVYPHFDGDVKETLAGIKEILHAKGYDAYIRRGNTLVVGW